MARFPADYCQDGYVIGERRGYCKETVKVRWIVHVRLSVSPPLIFRTSLQAAVAYVEGNRTGSVLFVAQTPGWHTFYAAPSALGGPRCGSAEFSLRRLFLGDPNCPTFDVNYAVTWRLARHTAGNNPRLAVPKPGETLVTMRIGG